MRFEEVVSAETAVNNCKQVFAGTLLVHCRSEYAIKNDPLVISKSVAEKVKEIFQLFTKNMFVKRLKH